MNYKIRQGQDNKTYISPIALYDEQNYYYAISLKNEFFAIYRNGIYQHKVAQNSTSAIRLLRRLNANLRAIKAI